MNEKKDEQVEDNSTPDSQADTKVIKKNEKQYKVTAYQVQPGDTFFNLAVKFYNNNKGMELIKSWNNIKNSKQEQPSKSQFQSTVKFDESY